MAQGRVPISMLPEATAVNSGDIFPIVQGGITKRGAIGLLNAATIGLFADASNESITTDFVLTSGYAALAKGHAFYQYDATVDAAYVTAHPRTSFISANSRGFKLSADQIANVLMFGAVADNATDNYAAFVAAIAWSKAFNFTGLGRYAPGGPMIWIPAGNYYISDTLVISHCFTLQGDGSGSPGGSATALRWPVNKCEIKVTTVSSGTILRGFIMKGVKGTQNLLYPGIWSQALIKMEDIFIDACCGPGIYIDGTSSNPANGWRVNDVTVQNSAHSGIYVDGADSNAGICTGYEGIVNDRYGIEDSSFLGNLWFFNNITSNGILPYIAVDPTCTSVFMGYTETGGGSSNLGGRSIGMGPQYSGVTGGSYLFAGGGDGGGLASSTGFYTRQTDTLLLSSDVMRARYGWGGPNYGGQQIAHVWECSYSTDGGSTYPITIACEVNGNNSTIGTNTGGSAQLIFNGQASVAVFTYGLTVGYPFALRAQNLVIGNSSTARLHDTAASIPTTGEYAQGSIIYNNAVSTTSNFAWACTTAGGVGVNAWQAAHVYAKSTLVTNDGGKTYVCITAGTSAGSGGPTGTAADITDGTVHWKYLAAFVLTPQYALLSRATTTSGLTMATAKMLGRTTGSTGAIEEITVGNGLLLATGSLTVTPAAAQANSTAILLADLVTDFNALLAKMRTANLLAP